MKKYKSLIIDLIVMLEFGFFAQIICSIIAVAFNFSNLHTVSRFFDLFFYHFSKMYGVKINIYYAFARIDVLFLWLSSIVIAYFLYKKYGAASRKLLIDKVKDLNRYV